MGMPSINISFTEIATQTIERSERGIVALILKDSKGVELSTNPLEVFDATDIDATLTDGTKEQIKLALKGYENAPKKVLVYFISEEDTDYTTALEYFATHRFDYLAIPTVEDDGKTEEIVAWIKARRSEGKQRKAVLPNTPADCEGIINYTTKQVTNEAGEIFTTAQYCSRIAGLLAGTPLTISCTYAPLNELVDCSTLSKSDMDKAVEKGEFFVFFDGEKVKVARGVNSLVTTTLEKGEQFKKIKIVEAMDLIDEDIRLTAENSYLGRYSNSYDNKCLLVSAISSYFSELITSGILSSGEVEIDLASQRAYLKELGENASEMTDDEVKEANTRDKVFLKASVEILDAIEEITLPISI